MRLGSISNTRSSLPVTMTSLSAKRGTTRKSGQNSAAALLGRRWLPMVFLCLVSTFASLMWWDRFPEYMRMDSDMMTNVKDQLSTIHTTITETMLTMIMNDDGSISSDNGDDEDIDNDFAEDEDTNDMETVAKAIAQKEDKDHMPLSEFTLPTAKSRAEAAAAAKVQAIKNKEEQKKFETPKFILTDDDDNYLGDDENFVSGTQATKDVVAAELDNSDYFPKLVWLMSFPNSGTSYTMTMVSRATFTSTATNYGREVTQEDRFRGSGVVSSEVHVGQMARPLDITDGTSIGQNVTGPFYDGFSSKPLPKKYILTKTHCGNRCVDCPPEKYHASFQGFTTFFPHSCTSSSGIVTPDGNYEYVSYDMNNYVAKAIHLIRNPFHNIIARFHLERKHAMDKIKAYMKKMEDEEGSTTSKEEKLAKINLKYKLYNDTYVGFQQYCHDIDVKYATQVKEVFGENTYEKYLKDVPCHGEFYKYVNWHNYVAKGLDMYHIPTLRIYYENYEDAQSKQQQEVIDFLELQKKEEFREFTARHDYDSFFTKQQKQNVGRLVKRMANPKVYDLIKHYVSEEAK